ncbi:MAG: hypothetical protein MRK01_07735 [Candidatus Scalindua sp.]|nr:hypothetical protein [Candidatus Scalindua sp.]
METIRTILTMFMLLLSLTISPCSVQADQPEPIAQCDLEGDRKIPTIKCGEHTEGCRLEKSNDLDQFYFNGIAGQTKIKIKISDIEKDGDDNLALLLQIWDPDGVKIVDYYNHGNILKEFTLLKTGKYVMGISDVLHGIGGYTLQFDCLPPGDDAPCLTWGITESDTLNQITDHDFFTFQGAPSNEITIVVNKTTNPDIELKLEVWDPDGDLIVNQWSNGSIIKDLELEKLGTYGIGISDYQLDELGGYTVLIECPFGDCPPCEVEPLVKVVIDQLWSATFGGQFLGEFSPGDGLIINDMCTVIDENNLEYSLWQFYNLVDHNKKIFPLGRQRTRNSPGHHYFVFNDATIPADATPGKGKIQVNVRLKKSGELIGKGNSRAIPIYIK